MIPAELQRMIQALGQAKLAPSVPMPIQGPEPTPAAPPQTQTSMGGLQSAAKVLQTALNPTQSSNLTQAPDQSWLDNRPYNPSSLSNMSKSDLIDNRPYNPSALSGMSNLATPMEYSGGKVKPEDLYGHLVNRFRDSNLSGYVPPDGSRFGITKGSPEEWARFGLAVARQESGFNPKSTNLKDPGGSYGLYQFNQHQYGLKGNAYDPVASADAFVKSTEDLARGSRGIGGMGVTFGSIRRPWETTQHLPFADTVIRGLGQPLGQQ